MSKWKVIAPLGALAAAGVAAAALLARKKTGETAPKAASAAAKKAEPREVLMKTGEYSFVSGFKDAKTVEVTLDYDALRYGFDVIGEDFLTYSSDSHVAVISGEDFSIQMEYASFYKGEDFALIAETAQKKYGGYAPAAFGSLEGFRYREGDSVCFCLPVDEYSYLLLTLLKAEGSKLTLEEIAGGEELRKLLDTLKIGFKE